MNENPVRVEDTPEYMKLEEWARKHSNNWLATATDTLSVLQRRHPEVWDGDDEALKTEARRIAEVRLATYGTKEKVMPTWREITNG